MKNKVNYKYHMNNLKNKDQAVKDIIENIIDKKDNIDHILQQDLINQEESFKQKLERKRKKKKVSIKENYPDNSKFDTDNQIEYLRNDNAKENITHVEIIDVNDLDDKSFSGWVKSY